MGEFVPPYGETSAGGQSVNGGIFDRSTVIVKLANYKIQFISYDSIKAP